MPDETLLGGEAPPAGTPPAGTPPAGTPPAGTPPAGTPPAGTPPAGTPTTETPTTETPTTETPITETPTTETPTTEAPPETKFKAPEKYDKFSYPSDFVPGDESEKAFIDTFKKLELSQEQAQGVMTTLAAASAKAENAHQTQILNWETELKADTEYGGVNFDKNIGEAKKALIRFGSPELKVLLQETGYGSNPAIVKFFSLVGKAMAEDSFHSGGSGLGTDKTFGETLYPDQNKI